MDPVRLLVAAALVFLPLGWWLWRQSREKDPAVLWPRWADPLGLSYQGPPPELAGEWNGRAVAVAVDAGRVVAAARFDPQRRVRLEIGERAELEKAAGMVVPDRVEFPEDRAFGAAFLVRATPEEFGRLAVDPTLRRRLAALPGARLLASAGRVEASVPEVRREAELRELLDLAGTVADAAEHAG